MKMPIVSLNNMAMNESVAATCCYAAVNVNGYNYENVLSGGTITTAVTNAVTYGVDKSWSYVRGDYAEATNGPLVEYLGDLGYWTVVNKKDTFVKLATLTPIGHGTYVDGTGFIADLRVCDHKGSYCTYVQNGGSISPVFTKVHTGATVEHSASKNWAADHAAIRFNS